MMDLPVLLIAFDRLDTTERVFREIRTAQPPRLYAYVDAPRAGSPYETAKVEGVRNLIKRVDWPCDVVTFFPDVNLGARRGVSEAISWFFCHEEMGIVLEHDCLPSPDFFRFCQEMLLAYRTDTRVFHVGGTAVPVSTRSGETASYSFIRIPLIWGWASWRRAWGKYSLEMAGFDEFVRCNSIRSCVTGLRSENNWLQYFHRSCQGAIDSWDYQWTFAMMKNHALAVIPHRNLVSNIGFGSDSLHSRNPRFCLASLPIEKLDWPLRKPELIAPDYSVEEFLNRRVFRYRTTKYVLKKLGLLGVAYRARGWIRS